MRKTPWYALGAVLLLSIVVIFTLRNNTNDNANRVTAKAERGIVQESVSVSGFIEAKNKADLSFPTTGIVTGVLVSEGDVVTKGDLLATLGSRTLLAQRSEAVALLRKAEASYSEVVRGPREEAQLLTTAKRTAAEEALVETIALEEEKVQNALSAFLSDGLTSRAEDPKNAATPPTVTGTYTCDEQGLYTLRSYRSSSHSGYSYSYSGLESGISSAYTRQPAPLGTCGLYIQFTQDDNYSDKIWVIEVPNTNNTSYVTNKNAYELALQNQAQAVSAAENTLAVTENETTLANALPTSEEEQQALASIKQAQAQIAAVDAQIEEKSIIAPFDGVITNVDVLPGETAGSEPIITLLAENAFELTARIPEIDITKIHTQQRAEIVFDAQTNQMLTGSITYVSPLATEIDGVAYFETTINLEEEPEWIRSGLNADVEIITKEQIDTLRIPTRFLIRQTDDSYLVLTLENSEPVETKVEVLYVGNNGYASITGLAEGNVVVAP